MTKSPPSSCHTTPRRERRAGMQRVRLQLYNKKVRRCLFRPLDGERGDSPIVRVRNKLQTAPETSSEPMQDVNTFVFQVPPSLRAEDKTTIAAMIYDLMVRLFQELHSMRRRNVYQITSANVGIAYNPEKKRLESHWDMQVLPTTPPCDPDDTTRIDLVPTFIFLKDRLHVLDPNAMIQVADHTLREQIWWYAYSVSQLQMIMFKLLYALKIPGVSMNTVKDKVNKLLGPFYGFMRVTPECIRVHRCTCTVNTRLPHQNERLRINGYECTCIDCNNEFIVLDASTLPQRGSWIEQIYEYTYINN